MRYLLQSLRQFALIGVGVCLLLMALGGAVVGFLLAPTGSDIVGASLGAVTLPGIWVFDVWWSERLAAHRQIPGHLS